MHSRVKVLVFLVCGTLLCLFLIQSKTASHIGNISDLEIENHSSNYELLSFEDAVHLKAKLTGSTSELAENELRNLEMELTLASGNSAIYYRFKGEFTFPQIPVFNGQLSTLVIVADSEFPYIYAIDKPISEVFCNQSNVQWTQMDSAYTIDVYQTTARLSAMGYVTVYDRKHSTIKSLSNTIYPTFTFALKDVPT